MSTGRRLRTVELVQAFLWTCDDCGRDHFERAIRIEPESVEGTEIAELAEVALDEANESAETLGIRVGGDWLMAPSLVSCPHCGAKFKTTEPNSEDSASYSDSD